MKRERKRAAHLGSITIGPERYTVLFQNGWLKFRRYRSRRRVEAITLTDAYHLARQQKCFAFVP